MRLTEDQKARLMSRIRIRQRGDAIAGYLGDHRVSGYWVTINDEQAARQAVRHEAEEFVAAIDDELG
jgi:hypothetical protein